jgi:cleavage stimulation factor subunit 3
MAEYDPDLQDGSWGESEGYGVTEGDQQDHVEHSTDQDQADYSLDPPPDAPGDMPSADGTTDDVGDYDPVSVTTAPPLSLTPQMAEQQHTAPHKPSPQPAAKKPRTAGGFLVGDSDSEDDDAPAPVASGQTAGAQSHSPLQNSLATKDSANAPSNAAPVHQVNTADVPASTNGLGSSTSAGAGPSTSAATAVAPSARRAPHDKVGFLEDRIRDDARGAMDAWLALMAEHRVKNNVEEARSVYKRFLEIFPQAVSRIPQSLVC